jgi:hypothetical protein
MLADVSTLNEHSDRKVLFAKYIALVRRHKSLSDGRKNAALRPQEMQRIS